MSLTGEREIPPQYAVSPVILGPLPLSEVFLNNRIMDLHHLCITNLSRPMSSVFVSTFVCCWVFLNHNYLELQKKYFLHISFSIHWTEHVNKVWKQNFTFLQIFRCNTICAQKINPFHKRCKMMKIFFIKNVT